MTIQNNPKHDSSDSTSPAFDQAVVIGSGLAGLTAARVLADHCAQVKIVERDLFPNGYTRFSSWRSPGLPRPHAAAPRPGHF